MRVYRISCQRCGWDSQLPVDGRVADEFRKLKYCRDCMQAGVKAPYTIREKIVTYPTRYYPSREKP